MSRSMWGQLDGEVLLYDEKHPLVWLGMDEDFF